MMIRQARPIGRRGGHRYRHRKKKKDKNAGVGERTRALLLVYQKEHSIPSGERRRLSTVVERTEAHREGSSGSEDTGPAERKNKHHSLSVGWSGLTSVWPITALADHPHCTRPTPSPPLEFARTVGTRSKFEMKVGDVNGIAVGIRPDGKLKYQIVSC